MNGNIVNLLKRVGVVSVTTALITELTVTYISNRLKKTQVIIVPAEPTNKQGRSMTLDEYIANMAQEETDNEPISDELLIAVEDEERKEAERILKQVGGVTVSSINYNKIDSWNKPDDETKPPAMVNVFEVDTDWDYEKELSTRDPELPYIIHADEYEENQFEYKQESVTYYEGDDTMATMADVPIHNWPSMFGQLRWGHGSKDKSIVYIRNERMHKEWEVILHGGSYDIEVQGLHIEHGELKHPLRKFRDD